MLDGSRKKFQLGLIYLFVGMAIFGVGPFIVIRYLQGEYLKAFVDSIIVLAAAMNALYASRTGNVVTPSILASILYTTSTVAVIYLNQAIFVFWLFPAMTANFFLLGPRVAILVNLIMLCAILPIAARMEDYIAGIGIVVAFLFAGSMTYAFARLANQQQAMLETFATQDPLTGLGNRRSMDEEMRHCIDDLKRSQSPASLIVLDLDYFKAINDNHGHREGDDLLVKVAELLAARVRKTDRCFRFGGEEFVVLARNTALPAARVIAEDLREQIERHISSPTGAITASFGCAQLIDSEDIVHWLERADQAMYRAKESGRNQVVLA